MYDRFYCTVDISQYCAQVSRFKVEAGQSRQRGALTATITKTPENNDLIGGMRKNNYAARAAHTLGYVVCQITT